MFCCLNLVQHTKVLFLLERFKHFFSPRAFLLNFKYFHCHCIYNCAKKKKPFMLSKQRQLIIFSLFTLRFFIRKYINVRKIFSRGGRDNWLKLKHFGKRVYVKWIETSKRERKSKIGNLEETYFLKAHYFKIFVTYFHKSSQIYLKVRLHCIEKNYGHGHNMVT